MHAVAILEHKNNCNRTDSLFRKCLLRAALRYMKKNAGDTALDIAKRENSNLAKLLEEKIMEVDVRPHKSLFRM